MSFLRNLPKPSIIEELSYEALKEQVKKVFMLAVSEYQLLESDPYAALIESIAYREMLLRERMNEAIRALLLPFSSGENLDNLVAIYGIERLKGAFPRAKVELALSTPLSTPVTIPQGTVFRGEKGEIALLKSAITIPAEETKSEGVIELQTYIKESAVKCEYIQTPLPFLVKAKQNEAFSGGADREKDEDFKERAILSLERFSTAGSVKGYRYHTLSVNPKIEEVAVLTPAPGEVRIVLRAKERDEEILNQVESVLTGEKVRPMTDFVTVEFAKQKKQRIEATLELHEMHRQEEVSKKILASRARFSIGEDLNLSYIYSVLHQEGVYRAILSLPTGDILVDEDEYLEIESWNLTFKEAMR